MTVRFDERGSELQVKALSLGFSGQIRMLLAIDSVGATRAQCASLQQAVAAATSASRDDVVISCSHSHSTPFMEPLGGPHPYFDLVQTRSIEAAVEAVASMRPARIGHTTINVRDASFNTRVPFGNGGVKFARDYREGLASGRPIDPRMNIVRIDEDSGKAIAGWIRFAAHPACVIFNAPVSAEYPGYLTDQLSRTVAGGAPVLFGYGASGDVNCIPMFGSETDSAKLGQRLANLASPVFVNLKTQPLTRFASASRDVELPLDPVPSTDTLDQDIDAVRAFAEALDGDPTLEWVLGANCNKTWSVKAKKAHAAPLAEWASLVKEGLAAGARFPHTWRVPMTAWLVDDLAQVFYGGEPLVELALQLTARSPLPDTVIVALSNGCDAYLGTGEDRKRGGYELYTSTRYAKLADGSRPLPYALGAGERFLRHCTEMIDALLRSRQ